MKVSNEEWVSKLDPESEIIQMKDGCTHLAYKAEHVVDLKSDLVLAAEIRRRQPPMMARVAHRSYWPTYVTLAA